jgi:hypothetical protein
MPTVQYSCGRFPDALSHVLYEADEVTRANIAAPEPGGALEHHREIFNGHAGIAELLQLELRVNE